jgi:flagellar protein FliO/FliZ
MAGIGEMFLSLVLVLVLIFALAWVLRRVQGVRGSRAGALQVHAGLSLGAKEKIVWIEAAGGKHLLVGVTPAGISLLHSYEQAPEMAELPPAATPPIVSAFAAKLNEALGRKPS